MLRIAASGVRFGHDERSAERERVGLLLQRVAVRQLCRAAVAEQVHADDVVARGEQRRDPVEPSLEAAQPSIRTIGESFTGPSSRT